MTLLESIIALVILSLAAVGALGVFQQANRSASNAQAWTVAASLAEQVIEAAKISRGAVAELDRTAPPAGFVRRLGIRPGPRGLSDVSVTIVIPGGQTVVAHRLMESK